MLSKTISTSRRVNRLPDRSALLYSWLIPHTDDFGRMEGDAMTVRAKVVPMRPSTEQEVEQDLELMAQNGLVVRYEVSGQKYLEISNFGSFQTFRSDRPRRAEYPDPDGKIPVDNQWDTNDTPKVDISQRKVSKGKVSKGKVREGKGTATPIPEWMGKESWDLWVKYRAEIKKRLTPRTAAMQIRFLSDHRSDHEKIINKSVMNGWTGLFPIKDDPPVRGSRDGDYARAHEKRIRADQEDRDRREAEKGNDALRRIREQAESIASQKRI